MSQPSILSEILGCYYQLISTTDNGAKPQFTDKLTQNHEFNPDVSIIIDFIKLVQSYTKPQPNSTSNNSKATWF